MPQIFKLADGVEGCFIENDRFNTTLISFNFYLPLRSEDYAANALLPYVLSSCCDEYKSFRELNLELGNIYGATLTAGSTKLADYQRISLSVSVINDEYSLDGDKILNRAATLLANLIFAPSLDGEAFFATDVEREKAQMLDRISGEINNKRSYARAKTVSAMFGDAPYGIPRFGTKEDMQNVDGKMLFLAWQKMLRESFIRVNIVGKSLPDGVFSAIEKAFNGFNRNNITSFNGLNYPTFTKCGRIEERMDITQGKLVMGFTLGGVYAESETAATTVMCDIFGGGPYSRLFSFVREKLNLCYYCAASAVKNKGYMLVDSGIEAENADKAEKEIFKQLDVIKNGKFTNDEFNASIRNICDSVKSVEDSQEAQNNFYAARVFDSSVPDPETFIKLVSSVTREDVINAAKNVELHTVYTLLPQEN